jgi:TIR domain/Tetratricopeptide repeat
MPLEEEPPLPIAEAEKGALVFFSYAPRDKWLRDKLENHLSNLKYRGMINTWHDQEIGAGEDWMQQVDTYLNKSHVILLLISADFMASEYCYSKVLMYALERHKQQKATAIPILLRPVLFTGAPFVKLQMLPTNRKPITSWTNRDSAFVDIANGIAIAATKYLPPQRYKDRSIFASPPTIPRSIKNSFLSPLPLILFIVGLLVTSILAFPLHANLIPITIVFCFSLLASSIVTTRKAIASLRNARRRYEEYLLYGTAIPLKDTKKMYYEETLRIYQHALLKKPFDGDIFRGIGNVFYAQERYNEALNAFQQATNYSPTSNTYAGLANVLARLQRYSEAIVAYEKAIELDPTITFEYHNIIESLLALGRKEEAEQVYIRAKQFGYYENR